MDCHVNGQFTQDVPDNPANSIMPRQFKPRSEKTKPGNATLT
jgi:hypothetical protein